MKQPAQPSYLFTLRFWFEPADDGRNEWRARVQYVYSNQAYEFRDWQTLVAYLARAVAKFQSNCDD